MLAQLRKLPWAAGGLLVDCVDQRGVHVRPDGVEGGDRGPYLVFGHAGELLPDEDPGGEHGFAAQDLVAAVASGEDDGDVGAFVVPQVAPELEPGLLHPLRLVTDQDPELLGECLLEEGVELDRAGRGLTWEPQCLEETVSDVARGRSGP